MQIANRACVVMQKSIKFARAKFFCRLCEYHCDNEAVCERHITEPRHTRLMQVCYSPWLLVLRKAICILVRACVLPYCRCKCALYSCVKPTHGCVTWRHCCLNTRMLSMSTSHRSLVSGPPLTLSYSNGWLLSSTCAPSYCSLLLVSVII